MNAVFPPVTGDACVVAREQGPRWLGLEKRRVDAVSVVRNGTASLCTLSIEGREHRLVLKRYQSSAAAQQVESVVSELARSGLSDVFPTILGRDGQWLAREYLPGDDLLTQMRRDARRMLNARSGLDDLVVATAQRLARVHTVPAGQTALPRQAETNEKFARTLPRMWTDAGFDRLLPRRFRNAGCVLEHLSPAVLRRHVQQVQLIDSRPKNTLVVNDREVRFIDLAFASGNPAQGLAVFIAAIDRFLLRELHPLASHKTSRWQAAFVAAYASVAPVTVMDDLQLFYPWVVASMCLDHCRRRPLEAPLLRRFYARRLSRYLERWSDQAVRDRVGAIDLFSHA